MQAHPQHDAYDIDCPCYLFHIKCFKSTSLHVCSCDHFAHCYLSYYSSIHNFNLCQCINRRVLATADPKHLLLCIFSCLRMYASDWWSPADHTTDKDSDHIPCCSVSVHVSIYNIATLDYIDNNVALLLTEQMISHQLWCGLAMIEQLMMYGRVMCRMQRRPNAANSGEVVQLSG